MLWLWVKIIVGTKSDLEVGLIVWPRGEGQETDRRPLQVLLGLRRLDPDVSEAGDMTSMTSMTLDKDPRAVGRVSHCKQIKSPD